MNTFADKVLLITGGTGSFGQAVLERVRGRFAEIRIFSRDEKKQDDLRHRLQDPRVTFHIGDVRDRASVDGAMRGVDYVFSAAGLKQVPSCEFFPMQAVYTNILGTANVLESAVAHGVSSVVVLSTDKAAYPVSAMGMTKGVMEKVAVAKGRGLGADAATTIVCTRLGNVMGSRGSVIPLFLDQLVAGAPLTVTDPGMTRFMVTLDDAVDLVLYAWEHGKNGDLFVQKSPAATIGTLAEAVLALAREGGAFKTLPELKVIGARHGEKRSETLVTREEMCRAIDLGAYYRVPADGRDLNYGTGAAPVSAAAADGAAYDSGTADRLDLAGMKRQLLRVPLVRRALGFA